VRVETGRFGAMMDVELLNDGPVTILLDSEELRAASAPADERAPAAPATGAAPATLASLAAASAAPVPSGFASRRAMVASYSPLRELPLTLASASDRRRDLLEEIGLPFTIDPSDVDESHDVPSDPEAHVRVLAERKARSVAARRRGGLVLGADTIVVQEGRIFGKPRDAEEALAMLLELAGREHVVWTGVTVVDAQSGAARTRAAATRVFFHPATEQELRDYVASGEPFGKAGAYAIQGTGRFLVERIEGDYTNVVGLPLGMTLDLLAEMTAT
jgi:septum formation protein